MADFSNSPFQDPNFLNNQAPAPAGEQLAGALASGSPLTRALAVSSREGNDLTGEGLGADLMGMSYGQLTEKYGEEVAQNRINITRELADQRRTLNTDRTAGQVVGDATLAAGSGFVGLVGGVGAAVLGGAGFVDQVFDEENTGLSEFSVGVAQTTADATGFINSLQSQELQDRKTLTGIESQLDAEDSMAQYQTEVAEGADPFIAALGRVGRDTLNTGGRILSDGAILGDTVAQALGSLGPSAKLASGGATLARGATDRFTRNEFAIKLANATGTIPAITNGQRIASAIGVSAGVGVAEASGAYMDTANSVMARTHEQMMTSPEYTAMIAQGIDPIQAQELVASSTALEAFGRQFPTAMALTLATGANAFNAAPLSTIRGKGLVDMFREMGSQALEEGFQGASAQLNQNIAIQNQVDASQLLSDGLGEQLATGAIAGAGMAGALAGPANVVPVLTDAAQLTASATGTVARAAGPIINAGGSGVVAAAGALSTAADTVPVVREALATIANATTSTLASVKEYANSANIEVAVKSAAAAKAAEIIGSELKGTIDTAKGAVADVVSKVSNSAIPAAFSTSVAVGGNVLSNVSGVMQKLASPETKLKDLGDSAILFAAENFSTLVSASNELPAAIKTEVAKVISSETFKSVLAAAKSIDLNKTQTTETEVTPETVTDTVIVAKTNPTNVNPEFVNKILEQPSGTVSAEDIVLLKAASKIASAVNNHAGEQVEIIKADGVALSQKPAYQANPKALEKKQSAAIDKVSRSVQVAGFKGLRSVNDFAADIFAGAQSEAGTVISDNVSIPVGKVVEQFTNFRAHMENKAAALLESKRIFEETGKATPVGFRSLSTSGKMVEVGGQGGAKPITYQTSEKAAVFNASLANDARVTAEVHDVLAQTFPKLFAQPTPEVQIEEVSNEKVAPEETQVEEVFEDQSNSKTGSEESTLASKEVAPSYRLFGVDIYRAVNAASQTPYGLSVAGIAEYFAFTKREALSFGTEIVETTLSLKNPLIIREDSSWKKITSESGWKYPTLVGLLEMEIKQHTQLLREQVISQGYDGIIVLLEDREGDFNSLGSSIKSLRSSFGISQVVDYSKPVVEDTTAVESNEEALDALADEVTEETTTVEEDQAVVDAVSDARAFELSELFQDTFTAVDGAAEYTDGQSLIDLIEHTEYAKIAKALLRPMMVRMNQRLQTVKFNKDMTVAEALQSGANPTAIRDYKNTMFVNLETMKYDPTLLSLATVMVIDWMSSARSTDPAQLKETLEKLGVDYSNLSTEDIHNIMYGISTRQAAQTIARQVLKAWKLQANADSFMIDGRGSVETLVKELLTVSGEMGVIDIKDIPTIKNGEEVMVQTLNVKRLQKMQAKIGLGAQNAVQKIISPEDISTPSIGSKITTTDQTQSRGNVKLSALEKRALQNEQDVPHYIAEGPSALTQLLGFDFFKNMLGFRDDTVWGKLHPMRASIVGKNLSIERDFNEAMSVVKAVQDVTDNEPVPVYYPIGISKVGRHQHKGINYQNNKILRGLVNASRDLLDMKDNTQHIQNFWLTVWQAGDLSGMKVENNLHGDILEAVEGVFNEKFGDAADLVYEWLKTGEINSVAFAKAMGTATMSQFSTVFAVAELRLAKENGKEAEFETTLAFELDGKTDGSANMMSNFGQGEVSEADYLNFKRVGFFIGKVGETLNNFFTSEEGKKSGDLYEGTSINALQNMMRRIVKAKPAEAAVLTAVANFSAAFGDLKNTTNAKGENIGWEMTRTTAKGPMTKTVYGSGVRGVATGIAGDMVMEFYAKMLTVPAGAKASEFLGYPTLEADFKLLFGETFNDNINWAENFLDKDSMKKFNELVEKGLGEILSQTAKDMIGAPITRVNDALVFLTGVQTEFLQALFERRLGELAEAEAVAGRIGRSKNNNKPIVAQISQRKYNALVAELRAYAPTYSNGTQTLAVGSFDDNVSNIELSSSMDGDMRMKSTMQSPSLAGVKIIPYLSIGRGDASLMNEIFGNNPQLKDIVQIFDGVDMPISKIQEYAQIINAAVLKNWDADVLADVEADFETFLSSVGSETDLLNQAYKAAVEAGPKKRIYRPDGSYDTLYENSLIAGNPQELLSVVKEMHRQNQARKTVFKRIPLSVDHMGGSNSSYSRGKGEMTLDEINALIRDELNGVSTPVEAVEVDESDIGMEGPVEAEAVEGEFSKLVVIDASSMVQALLKETRNKLVNQTLKAIAPLIPAGAKVVTGNLAQLQAYREAHFAADGVTLTDAKGMYDVANNTIFIADNNHETITHELVHMVSFSKVLAHYEGSQDDAVVRLEGLMQEFLDLNIKGSEAAQASILLNQNSDTAMSKAAALNEFMAWSLSNETLIKGTQSAAATIVKKVKLLMQRLLGKVPANLFENILFNTVILGTEDTGGNGDNINNNDDGGLTNDAHKFTNYWLDLVRERLADSANADGTFKRDRLIEYADKARDITVQLDFGGFNLSEYQKQTFMAIHTVLAMELQLDPRSSVALNKVFDHVIANLSPEMFGPVNQDERFSTVMNLFGKTKNQEGVSDAVAVLLALSQTSNGFRAALDQLPEPESTAVNDGTLNSFLENISGALMRKSIGTINTAEGAGAILDGLSQNLIRQEGDKELPVIRTLMSSVDKADAWTKGALGKLAERADEVDRKMKASDRSDLTKLIVGSVAYATQFVNEGRSKTALQGLKNATHMGVALDKFVPIREFVSEVVGTDKINKGVVALLDKTNFAVQSVRQAYREDLPGILARGFTKAPTPAQWKSMHRILGKTDFASIFSLANPQEAIRLLISDSRLNQKIIAAEKAVQKNFTPDAADAILEKTQQLANFMNGNGAGHQLWKNAYAINKLSGDYQSGLTAEIDQLVTMYALQGQDATAKREIVDIFNNDPEGIQNLVVYMQGLNKGEDAKIISEEARLNGYKGYIPDQGTGGSRLVIEDDAQEATMIARGFTKLGKFTGQEGFSNGSLSYYTTTVKQGGLYSQGVMQSVQSSYRGVDAKTGLTVNGTTSGVIRGEVVDVVTDELNLEGRVENDKEVLIPVQSADGIIMYERAMNPDLLEAYTSPKSNLALMLGAWAGRQVEEQFAKKYNAMLVSQLKTIWDKREVGSDDLFIDISSKDVDDKVFQDIWRVISPETKALIEETFAEEEGFMIRKDMINLALGYREASITDVWSGKTRMPEAVTDMVKAVSKRLLGDKAMTWASKGEEGYQGVISAAKDIIVVRSLVVPALNIQANMFQLWTRGVGTKAAIRGTRDKLAEIEQYNENVKSIIEIEARIQLAGMDKNKVSVLQQQRQAIWDQNSRMTIAPMINEGQYKNISEGITDMDVEITSGRLGDWVEAQVNKLPKGAQTVAKYGMLSKDTAIYRGANKAVQYGDFIAKGIYYDHLVGEGKTHAEAMEKVNEEFVNFSVLPGRSRSYLESMGATWFMTFKIRIMKVALSMLQNNPVRSLITAGVLPDVGSPIGDNLIAKTAEGTIDYAIGTDMLFGAPDLNPWVNLIDWAGE